MRALFSNILSFIFTVIKIVKARIEILIVGNERKKE